MFLAPGPQSSHGSPSTGCADRDRCGGQADSAAAGRVYFLVTRRVKPALDPRHVRRLCNAIAWVIFPKASWIYWTGTFLESDRSVWRTSATSPSTACCNGCSATPPAPSSHGSSWPGWSRSWCWWWRTTSARLPAPHRRAGPGHHPAGLPRSAGPPHWILILPLLLVAAFPDRPVPSCRVLQGCWPWLFSTGWSGPRRPHSGSSSPRSGRSCSAIRSPG